MLFENPYFATGNLPDIPAETPFPSVDEQSPLEMLQGCSAHCETPLRSMKSFASGFGVKSVYLKDETNRMGMGSFKALGAAYVIAHEAAQTGAEDLGTALVGRTFITASAGNHGLSVAAGARVFGAGSVIYLAETVPDAFVDRLREKGAVVCVEGADYEASMAAAQKAAKDEGFTLLSDSSWDGYFELPHRLMEGYLVCAKEAVGQIPVTPTHIYLQAGVGGLAGAMAAYFRKAWGNGPIITVVEPEAAPALQTSIRAGKSVYADGPVSNMGRLDCKEPSLIALKGLARDANFFLTINDQLAADCVGKLEAESIHSTPSGVAGLAGLAASENYPELALNQDSVVLCIISEGAE